MQLTVLVLVMYTVYPSVWQHLQVKPDAHVAVQPPHSLDAHQIVVVPRDPEHGAREQRFPPCLERRGVGPARGRDPEQKAQQDDRRPRRRRARVARAALAPGHAVEALLLRNGRPVYRWRTWSTRTALKIPLASFRFLRAHGGRGLFLEGGSGSGASGAAEIKLLVLLLLLLLLPAMMMMTMFCFSVVPLSTETPVWGESRPAGCVLNYTQLY